MEYIKKRKDSFIPFLPCNTSCETREQSPYDDLSIGLRETNQGISRDEYGQVEEVDRSASERREVR
jgi:hypothetical protein